MLTFMITLLVNIALMYIFMPEMDYQKPRAATLDEFSFPTAEDRPVPVAFGTIKIEAPNVLWYDNLSVEPVIKKIDGGPFHSDKKIVQRYKYFFDIQMGICYGEARINKIYEQEKIIWEYKKSTWPLAFWKGPDDPWTDYAGWSGNEDYFHGQFEFFYGSRNQQRSVLLENIMGDSTVSAFRNLSYIVFKKAYIGNSTQPKAIAFEVERFPKGPSGSTEHNINGDANPAYMIYEILTDRVWGMQTPRYMIDEDSFHAAASQFANEGLGLSFLWSSQTSYDNVLNQIYNHCECRLRTNHKTGLVELYVIRNNYNTWQLLRLDKTNITSVLSYSKGSVDTVNTEVRVKFKHREHDYAERYVLSQNNGTINNRRQRSIIDKDYTMFKRPELAQRAADRDMIPASSDIANARIICNRDAQSLNIGDPVLVDLPRISLQPTVFRVTSIDLGTINSNRIQLDLVQDVFGLQLSLYKPTFTEGKSYLQSEPKNALNVAIAEIPYALTGDKIAIFATAPEGLHYGYQVFEKDGTYGSYNLMTSETQGFSPHSTLTKALSTVSSSLTLQATRGTPILQTAKDEEKRLGMNLALIYYPDLNQQEFIAYSGYSYDETSDTYTLTGVWRGLLDTVAKEHAVGAKILFLGGLYYSGLGLSDPDKAYYKLLTEADGGTLPFDVADQYVHDYLDRFSLPAGPRSLNAYKNASGTITASVTRRAALYDKVYKDGETRGDADLGYVKVSVHDMDGKLLGSQIANANSIDVPITATPGQDVVVTAEGSDQNGWNLSVQKQVDIVSI